MIGIFAVTINDQIIYKQPDGVPTGEKITGLHNLETNDTVKENNFTEVKIDEKSKRLRKHLQTVR